MMGLKEVETLLNATFKILDSAKKANDANNIGAEIAFINLFVDTLVSRTLKVKPNQTVPKSKQAAELTAKYARVKLGIQESVALGFQTAVGRIVKEEVEFTCVIKAIQDPKSTISH